jgi:hypothetical protein
VLLELALSAGTSVSAAAIPAQKTTPTTATTTKKELCVTTYLIPFSIYGQVGQIKESFIAAVEKS